MRTSALALPRTSPRARRVPVLVRDLLTDYVLLSFAYLAAIYFRQELPFGKYVGANYEWEGPQIYGTICLSLLVTFAVAIGLDRGRGWGPVRRFWTAYAGIGVAAIGLTAFVPRQSLLEKGYFVLFASLLVTLVLPWPRSADELDRGRSLSENLRRLWANRSLVHIWVQYSVRSRYSQAVLGIVWVALVPLMSAAVLTIVFSHIMRIQAGNVHYVVFFMAGFVPWALFNQSIGAAQRAIIGNLGLIGQIYFPREVIVISALGEALVDTFFLAVAMVIIDAIKGVYPGPLWLCLPLLLAVEIILVLGVMLILSWLSVLIRDIPQLVSVGLQILFYLSPVIYPLAIIPAHFRFLVTLNPIAVLIEGYKEIIVYGSAPDWGSLMYPTALGLALLIFGYRLFKANEDRMADLV